MNLDIFQSDVLKIVPTLEYYVADPHNKQHEIAILTITTERDSISITGNIGHPQQLSNILDSAAWQLQNLVRGHRAKSRGRQDPGR